ncbi:MAG: exodeoxyribonuclease VII large subunit [Desulfomonilaceae bacterium]
MELPERKVYTVAELTAGIRDLLESSFTSVWVRGEITGYRPAHSGHLYFSLKDAESQISCVMFKTQSRFLKFRPEDGLEVVVWGKLTVYGPRGQYQLVLDSMEPVGLGSLMLAFEQLKQKLQAEGLFDARRKKPLPPFPYTIGIVTSPHGAAIRDMIRIISRRFPPANIVLSPASVQGDKAPEELVEALRRLERVEDIDVIIIGRGGGSAEDLWAFNDERVVRAVAECPIPIVSAVGHEIDFTLTDFAADLRASTPSAAAELVVRDRNDLMEGVRHLVARMTNAMQNLINTAWQAVDEAMKRLPDPRRRIMDQRASVEDLSQRLARAMSKTLSITRQDAYMTYKRLRPDFLRNAVERTREERALLQSRLERAMAIAVDQAKMQVEGMVKRLESVSPLAVLARGYSITFLQKTGAVVTDARDVGKGDALRIRLHKGDISCKVTSAHTNYSLLDNLDSGDS